MTLECAPPVLPCQAWCDPAPGLPLLQSADAVLALSLFTTWAVRTGRVLRPVPVPDLTAEELIEFWADDQLEPEGSYPELPSRRSCRTGHRPL
jgi:hypothetical protein